jgi:hypothetical protein
MVGKIYDFDRPRGGITNLNSALKTELPVKYERSGNGAYKMIFT